MVWAALLVSVATGSAQETKAPAAVIQWHYVGRDRLAALPEQKALQQVINLPETAALREAALDGWSQKAGAHFAPKAPVEAQKKAAEAIRQLLPDLPRFETRFEMVESGERKMDWALAIKLPEERVRAWREVLTQLAREAGLTVEEGENWTARRDPYRLGMRRENGWTVLRGGYSSAEAETRLFASFRRSLSEKPGQELLAADFNFPQLGAILDRDRMKHAPRLAVTTVPSGDGLRTELNLEYAHDLGIKPEKWEVPLSLIHEPLNGFTAIQGIAKLLEDRPRFADLGAEKVPNQWFAWSLNESPFSILLAAKVGNPQVVVSNVAHRASQLLENKASGLFPGQVVPVTNQAAFVLRGVPVALPFVEAGTGAASEFIEAGLFRATASRTDSPPAELFEQLKKKNLIYYEWEITQSRLGQWRPVWQLAQILRSPFAFLSDAPSEKWIQAIAPKLGNTVTEAVLQDNRHIRVIRQSHIGFNALELVLLAHWLDPRDFRERSNPGNPPGAPGPQRKAPPKTPSNAETGR